MKNKLLHLCLSALSFEEEKFYLKSVLLPAILTVFAITFLPAQEVLRGEVWVELEPAYESLAGQSSPLDADTARRRVLEEAAFLFAGMIYGWSFDYDIGEVVRNSAEKIDLHPLGTILFGDAGLYVTDAYVQHRRLYIWADYRLSSEQSRRFQYWKSGTVMSIQANGHSQLTSKQTALEDAARAGIRAVLRDKERNRPKEVHGYISLATFPHYRIDSGEWFVSARFRMEITDVIPFGAY
jgi:hypothetical protein